MIKLWISYLAMELFAKVEIASQKLTLRHLSKITFSSSRASLAPAPMFKLDNFMNGPMLRQYFHKSAATSASV
jgi:hypothetical protein